MEFGLHFIDNEEKNAKFPAGGDMITVVDKYSTNRNGA